MQEPYPQADFEKNLPAWAKLVASGRKSLDTLAAMVGSKAPLTEAQKQALRAAALQQLQANTVDEAPAVTPAPAQPASEPEPAPAAGLSACRGSCKKSPSAREKGFA